MRLVSVSVHALAVATLLAAATSAPSLAACAWKIVASPNDGTTYNSLTSVSASSATDAWAAGVVALSNPVPIAEHWNGTKWLGYKPGYPNDGAAFQSVTDVSTTEAWAVGYSVNAGAHAALTERWNGKAWAVVAVPAYPGHTTILAGVASVSSTDRWAVGNATEGTQLAQTYALFWGGSKWARVVTLNVAKSYNALGAVSGTSEDDVWAVGVSGSSGAGPFNTLIEHWNGTKWSIVPSPNVKGASNQLVSVSAFSATNVWAVGLVQTPSAFGTLTEHWNGTKWDVVASPNVGNSELLGVVTLGPKNVWAVGSGNGGTLPQALAEHWAGSRWVVVNTPDVRGFGNILDGLAVIPGTTEMWAAGGTYDASLEAYHTLTEQYACASADDTLFPAVLRPPGRV
jgi:hypothetical protein